MQIARNILLNPGPATTTDTVKLAQVVPDICPRERDFGALMDQMRRDLVSIVHGDPAVYTAVLFCGSGTLNMDVCLNSLLPAGGAALIVNNGSYSARAVEICQGYGLPYLELTAPFDQQPDLKALEAMLSAHPEVALVYATHHETGTGLINPIADIGRIAHAHGALFVVDTTSTYALRPIDLARDEIDFCMASAQKGLQAMAGLSFIVGRRDAIEASAAYPRRSYYCNLYNQYAYFEKTGQMHFTPPVQTLCAAAQAIREYFAEGEAAKWARHQRVSAAIHAGLERLGFAEVIPRPLQSGLVAAARYPDDPRWDFDAIHDFCYARGFVIYPGKIERAGTFRLCALGAIDEGDIAAFFEVFEAGLRQMGVALPVVYEGGRA
ncbi:MAG: 2-aminoethylphosphonate aminotransferase [Christensenellales bacterium]|jgi:2-aminoethylphosphonate-pyruvate transaminase